MRISAAWTGTCLARADRRATGFLGLSCVVALVAVMAGAAWIAVLAVPVSIELAVPGLRHFVNRRTVRRLVQSYDWRPVSVRFVPGRARVGRQAYLEMSGSDRTYLRLPEMPERVRVLVRHTGRVWLAGPDDRGRAVVINDRRPFLTLGRVVIR